MEVTPGKDWDPGVATEVGLSDRANAPLRLCPPQDTAEYVAYVAKDPVNQRGEAWWERWVGGGTVCEASEQDPGS